MKTALILAGGKGLRFRSETEDVPKPMILLGGKPILFYVICLLGKLGIENIYIVVGYKKELIMDYFKDGKRYGIKIKYIENKCINDSKKCGLSDAVLLARDFINEPFLTILGDEIYVHTKHKEMVSSFEKDKKCESMIAVYETENIDDVKKNYSVKIDSNWNVLDLEEKPLKPWNNLVGCGTYLFKPSIFEYIENTKVSQRSGRKELADTLKLIVEDKKILKAFSIGGKYLNINYPEDLNYAERILRGE